MPFTESVIIPSDEELTVQELDISYCALRAGAFHLGKYCEDQSKEYFLCRMEEQNPIKCLPDGKALTSCAIEFFRKIKKSCHKEFDQYANCLNQSSGGQRLEQKTQGILDKCVLDNLGIERPHFSYYTWARTHHTDRPSPKDVNVFPGAAEEIPWEKYEKNKPQRRGF